VFSARRLVSELEKANHLTSLYNQNNFANIFFRLTISVLMVTNLYMYFKFQYNKIGSMKSSFRNTFFIKHCYNEMISMHYFLTHSHQLNGFPLFAVDKRSVVPVYRTHTRCKKKLESTATIRVGVMENKAAANNIGLLALGMPSISDLAPTITNGFFGMTSRPIYKWTLESVLHNKVVDATHLAHSCNAQWFLIPLMIIFSLSASARCFLRSQNMSQVAGQEIIKGEILRKTANQVAFLASLAANFMALLEFLTRAH